MKRFNRRMGWIIVGLVGLLIVIAALVISHRRLADPLLNNAAPGEAVQVGAHGPLTLTFPEPVQPAVLESAFALDPPVSGRLTWNEAQGQSAVFWPEQPLVPGQRYTLRLQAGAIFRAERTWQVEVRQPDLLYLAPSRAPELWQVQADGQNPRALTTTGGAIYDYTVALDGSRILYSARNEQGGIDLWELERGAKSPDLLLPCGTDWCIEPAYSPDLQKIAYSRRTFSGLPGSEPGAPRLWIYERAANATDALLRDPALGGSAAAWSPDGRFLVFTDPRAAVVRWIDFQDKTDFFVPAGADSRAVWAPDGASFYMTKTESGEEHPYVVVYEVDAFTREARLWNAGNDSAETDYSLPIPSPDGAWLAVSHRQIGGGPGKQLWLVRADGSQPRAVAQDALANYAGYRWDPSSERLVFQRLHLSGSDSLPQIVLWNRKDGQQLTIAEDAFLPHWLP